MPWSIIQSAHHVIAAAVLFAASWAIRAWQAYRDPLDGIKAGYIAFDQLESQVRHPVLLPLYKSGCISGPQMVQPCLHVLLKAAPLTSCVAYIEGLHLAFLKEPAPPDIECLVAIKQHGGPPDEMHVAGFHLGFFSIFAPHGTQDGHASLGPVAECAGE